ncbi:MAG: hypothetical protein IPL36_13685 [Nigerium sp.]|nr:hypothetical protein [Nigerium sp.]
MSRMRTGAMVAGAAIVAVLNAGCSQGPADITCAQFIKLSTSEQMDTVKAWREKKSISIPENEVMAGMALSSDAVAMNAYCSKAKNAKDKLLDLSYTWG